jgi:uncharacterized protein (TIGR02996 family)
MPVAVSLEQLVTTSHALHLWPEEFRAIVAKLEEEPEEMTQWLVLADWLGENGEKDLEATCRWYARRMDVSVAHSSYSGWRFEKLPLPIDAGSNPPGDMSTLAGAIAVLTARLRRVKEALA